MATAMDVDEVLVVDIEGPYGHFRKNYTTSSPLTHEIPPRTALTGLLGAIMGCPRQGEGNYHSEFAPARAKIGVSPRRVLTKQRINKNLLKVKGKTANLVQLNEPPSEITRSQVPFEMLRRPSYRLYIWHEDEERMLEIERQLENHRSVYTPSLGLSELLADFEYKGRFTVEVDYEDGLVDSVVNVDEQSVKFQPGKRYSRENISLSMNENRVVQSFADVMYGETTDDEDGRSLAPLYVTSGARYHLTGPNSPDETVTFLTG